MSRAARRNREAWLTAAGLSEEMVHALATYNAERSRGLVHTAEYAALMAAMQQRWDEAMRTVHDLAPRQSPDVP